MSQKSYSNLTSAEKLALSSDDFVRAVKIAAIDHGYKLPLTLEQTINNFNITGFNLPAESVEFFEIVTQNTYGGINGTGIAFKTHDEAVKALKGAIPLYNDGYGATLKKKIGDANLMSVRSTWVTFVNGQSVGFKLDEFNESTDDYDKFFEECREDLQQIRQNEYNRRVLQQKRKEYMKLANNDESVARAFWVKVEGIEFPNEEGSELNDL